MTFWEFGVATQAWAKANGTGEEPVVSLSDDEHDALMAKHA